MAAIGRNSMLAAETVAFSKRMPADEEGTFEQLEPHRSQFIFPKIAEHCGRLIKATDNNLLVEFESPANAVQCAVELQIGMVDRNLGTTPDHRIMFRIGIDIGEVTANSDDLISRAVAALPADRLATLIKPGTESYGGGKIAARLARLADPGGICISGTVWDAIRGHLPYIFEDIGEQNLDNSAERMHCYARSAASVPSKPRLAGRDPRSRPLKLRGAAVTVSVFATVGLLGVALWARLESNSSRAPTAATVAEGSHIPSVNTTEAGAAALERQTRQLPLVSSATAVGNTQSPPVPPPSFVSNTAADRSTQSPPLPPALFEAGAAVTEEKKATSTLQIPPDNSAAAIRGIQAPPLPQTTPAGEATADRKTGSYWSQVLRSKSEWQQTRSR
jgi:class 3 adenylate cyclase